MLPGEIGVAAAATVATGGIGGIVAIAGSGISKLYGGLKSLFGGGDKPLALDDKAHPTNLALNVSKWVALVRSRGWSEERYAHYLKSPEIKEANRPYYPKKLWSSRDEWLRYALAADPAAYEAHRHYPGGETMPPHSQLISTYGKAYSGTAPGSPVIAGSAMSPALLGSGFPGGLTVLIGAAIILIVVLARKG